MNLPEGLVSTLTKGRLKICLLELQLNKVYSVVSNLEYTLKDTSQHTFHCTYWHQLFKLEQVYRADMQLHS